MIIRHRRFLRQRLATPASPLPRHRQPGTVRKTRKQNPELSLFDEMRELAANDPTPARGNSAHGHGQRRAGAGRAGKIGELSETPGRLIAIPAPQKPAMPAKPCCSRGDVSAA